MSKIQTTIYRDYAILKSIAMMTGELEFEGNFTVDMSINSNGSEVTLQILFLLFVLFVSIIIANLIIGLTVSEIDDLYNEARAIKLQKMVTQVNWLHNIKRSKEYLSF